MEQQNLSHLARERIRAMWRSEGCYGTDTLADAMRSGCATNADASILFHSDERPAKSTLGAMYAQSRQIAGALSSLSIKRGDVIAIQTPNWLEGALIYQAAMIIGAVIVPIIHIYGPAEVGFILRQSRAKVFVVPDRWRNIDYLERLGRLSDTPSLEHVIVLGKDAPKSALLWSQLLERARDPQSLSAGHADDCALLIYTSGTTSEPKGVRHSHNTLLAEVKPLVGEGTSEGSGVRLSPWPSGHIAGVLGILGMYVSGTRAILMDAWDAAAAARLIQEFKVTGMSGTPFYLNTLLDAAEQGQNDISSLRRFVTGAAGVPPALVERAESFGVFPFRCYGSTEHPTVTAGKPEDTRHIRAHTDGPPIAPSRVRIVDENGKDLPIGSDGEIVTIGPEQFLGYSNEQLNIDSFLPDGWFKTGDVGHLDAEGCLTLTDRKKDIIIRGGENISSKEVEDLLARHPAVQESAVVAMPDARLGEKVCAFVILKPGQSLDIDAIDRHFRVIGVARQKTPEHLVIAEELPRTAAGKVKKFELRDRLRREKAT